MCLHITQCIALQCAGNIARFGYIETGMHFDTAAISNAAKPICLFLEMSSVVNLWPHRDIAVNAPFKSSYKHVDRVISIERGRSMTSFLRNVRCDARLWNFVCVDARHSWEKNCRHLRIHGGIKLWFGKKRERDVNMSEKFGLEDKSAEAVKILEVFHWKLFFYVNIYLHIKHVSLSAPIFRKTIIAVKLNKEWFVWRQFIAIILYAIIVTNNRYFMLSCICNYIHIEK